jgi:hypothetical protein
MHDFEKIQSEFQADFDKRFKSMKKTATIVGGVYIAIVVAVLGGLGWAVYRLVTHFAQ